MTLFFYPNQNSQQIRQRLMSTQEVDDDEATGSIVLD